MNTSQACLLILTIGALGACRTQPVDSLESLDRSNIYATTSTPDSGVFEVELFGNFDPSDRFETNVALNYGANERTELSVQATPFVNASTERGRKQGIGNVALSVVNRFLEGENGSAAAGLSVTLPVESRETDPDAGELAGSASLVAMHPCDWGVLSMTYELSVSGSPEERRPDVGHSGSVVVARNLFEGLGAYASLSGSLTPEAEDETEAYASLGLAFSLTEQLLLDVLGTTRLDDGEEGQILTAGFVLAF